MQKPVLVFCNKIFLVQASIMYKNKGPSEIISFENEQCTCFGSAKSIQEQFLAKQKTFEVTLPPSNHSYKSRDPDLSFLKNTIKKSLKRQLVPQSPQFKNVNLNINDSLTPQTSIKVIQKSRESRQFLSPQCKPMHSNSKAYKVPIEASNGFSLVTVPQREIISCKNIQQSAAQSISPFSSYPPQQPTSITAFHSPAKLIKINYNSPIHSPHPHTSTPTHLQQKLSFSPISLSTNNPSRSAKTVNAKYLQEKEEIQRSQSTKIISKVQASEPPLPKDETFKSCVKYPAIKSETSAAKFKQEFKAETAKSGIGNIKGKKQGSGETGRSRTEVRSLKDQKSAFKKMDDVEEIYSQPDSEELSDSDKESVVLGRLNEYGSMIEPAISHTSERSEGKFMRFNSLSINLQQEIQKIQYAEQFLTY